MPVKNTITQYKGQIAKTHSETRLNGLPETVMQCELLFPQQPAATRAADEYT
mgnify:CR=1 FL=1